MNLQTQRGELLGERLPVGRQAHRLLHRLSHEAVGTVTPDP